MKRKAVSPRARFEIFKRDGFRCQYCGLTPPNVILHLDHILAVANGGSNEDLNLITSCQSCNLGKSDVPLERVIEPLKQAQEAELERREQVDEYNKFLSKLRKEQQKDFRKVSNYWLSTKGEDPKEFILGGEPATAVKQFLKRLPAQKILEAIDITQARVGGYSEHKFLKYFCGVCWKFIKEPAL
jgi:hypothetical protein